MTAEFATEMTAWRYPTRARRVVESLGFEYVSTFDATAGGSEHNVLVLCGAVHAADHRSGSGRA
jgi:hypothetical protein